jgi:hypothetical protein
MRFTKLTATAPAAALLLAFAASGASARPFAHRHESPRGNCRIGLLAEPHAITSGESVEVFGRLQCPGSSGEGQAVTVYGHAVGRSRFSRLLGSAGLTVIGNTTTGPGGFYSFVEPNVTTDTVFAAGAAGALSPRKAVKVAPVVTLSGPSEVQPLFTGFRNRVTFKGTVSPADTGAGIVLQREAATSSEEWHAIGFGIVGPGGAYSLSHKFVRPGDANLRVVVRKHGKFSVRGASNTLSYGISQRENPALTINTTAYSLPYGTPVTLSGALAGGAGKTVTLEALTFGGGFTTVASTTAVAGGQYSFVQVPLLDTAYRVIAAGPVTSAVLFEGVKYILTDGISSTTVQSGQALTISGTVTPVRPVTPGNVGKVVYLERLNAFGMGYHVADVTTVSAGGTYSLAHFLFGTGPETFRVKVPGDPDNQAVFSAPFTVEVTPAPPASLKPAAQPKQPSEGQV